MADRMSSQVWTSPRTTGETRIPARTSSQARERARTTAALLSARVARSARTTPTKLRETVNSRAWRRRTAARSSSTASGCGSYSLAYPADPFVAAIINPKGTVVWQG